MAPSTLCVLCSDPLPTDGRFMTCTDCTHAYHLGKKCSGIAESTFKGMSAAKIDKWRCLACRGGMPKASFEGESASSSQVEPNDFLAQLSMVHQKLALLLSWKDT
ncbi:unnamed protein product, partial [Ixodes hexagonus]